MKSNDRDNGPNSPTVPSITYDSLDDGRDGGQDSVSSIQQSGITNYKLRCHCPFSPFMLLKHLSLKSFISPLRSDRRGKHTQKMW